MSRNKIELVLSARADKLLNVLRRSGSAVHSFGARARGEFAALGRAASSLQGRMAGLGLSLGAAVMARQSAELDRGLARIGQTAGASRGEVRGLRAELFAAAAETGRKVEDLKQGFDNAVQSGLSMREALPVLHAVNKAMGVSGADAGVLTSGLTVAATAFRFDLARPGQAMLLLDKMTVAGRKGNAELENLSDIFARVGVNAQRAGMGFEQTLAFIEGLSLIERNPERLATLADSTLRLFTNAAYMRTAAKTTGVKFFDAGGGARDPLKVLADIKAKFDRLKTDAQRSAWLSKAFKGADLDTIKGLSTLLQGDMLSRVGGEIVRGIASAAGTIERDLPGALDNAIDQSGRLGAELRRAADGFIQPLNAWRADAIRRALAPKEQGGLGLSGEQMIAGGAGLAAAGLAAWRLGGAGVRAVVGRAGGTAAGIAEGKAVEAATGVQPVFVTNFPPAMGVAAGAAQAAGGAAAAAAVAGRTWLGKLKGGLMAGGKMLAGTAGGKLALAGAAGYGVGTLANAYMGAIVRAATDGRSRNIGELLYDLLHSDKLKPEVEVKNTIPMHITIDRNDRVTAETGDMNTTASIATLRRGQFRGR